jgi:antitoxin HicB
MNRKNIGSTFDSWLREEGLYGEVRAAGIQGVVTRKNLTLPDRSEPSGS